MFLPVFHSGRRLAHLPLRPNQIRLGNVILFAGRFWKISNISERGLTVDIVPAVSKPIRPQWSSKGVFTISSLLAHGMRELLLSQPKLKNHQFDENSYLRLENLYGRIPDVHKIKDAIWYEILGEKFVYYTFAGAMENNILQVLFDENDIYCNPMPKAEGIALIANQPLDFNNLPSNSGEIISIINKRWRHFTSWIHVGPFFEYLPPNLKKSETISQVTIPEVINNIKNFQGMPLEQVDLHLFN